MSNHYSKYAFVAGALLMAGCSAVQEITEQVEEFKEQVKAIEDTTTVSGRVDNRSGQNGPIVAALLKQDGNFVRVLNEYQVSGNGTYKFFTAPGTYTVSAFVDINKDGAFQDGEPATYLGESRGQLIEFELTKGRDMQLRPLVIEKALQQRVSSRIVYDTEKALENIGRVVKLGDPMFSRGYAEMGLWKPFDFSQEVGGGMFLLSKYRKGRIPLVFVHGIKGTPAEWKYIIKALDRKKFQPVLLHYPSGLPLDIVSEFMLKAINKLQNKYGFDEFYIAAHSMGGLVTRSFVKKYLAADNPARIGMVVTINSPMMGIESAVTGVKYMPIVVPVWRDVAFDSPFIRALHEWPWPPDIPYHLVFSYLEDEAGDGVASLQSQIPRSLQKETSGMYGFEAEHAGLLKKRYFSREFNDILRQNLLEKEARAFAVLD